MSHPRTHRKTLARRVAAASGLSYQQALARVIRAADTGDLPEVLDDAGMAEAVRRLVAAPQDAEVAAVPADLVQLADRLRHHGLVAEVIPEGELLLEHVRVHDPRNGVMEYLVGLGDPDDLSEGGIYGIAERNTLVDPDDSFIDRGTLPGSPADPAAAADAFRSWLVAQDTTADPG